MNDNDTKRFTSIGWQCLLIANRLRNQQQIDDHHASNSDGRNERDGGNHQPGAELEGLKKEGRVG